MAGCAITDIFKSIKTDYTINAKTDDTETVAYLKTILAERLTEKTKTYSQDDDADTRKRQEDYIEQTISADLLKALNAKGYYNAKIVFIDKPGQLSGEYDIEYGQKFTISSVDVLPVDYNRYLNEKNIHNGLALDAVSALSSQSELYDNIQKNRCYFSLNVANQVYLDRARHTGDIDFIVEAGREGNFGPVSFKNNGSVKQSYLRKLVPWKEGDCFRREKLEDYKTALLQSGLFSRAETILPEEPEQDGTIPVTIDLRERAQRSVSAGISYYSDEGPGAALGWEHRNFFGAAEKLKAELSLSLLKQSLDLNFNKPYFLRKNQSFSATSSLRRQDTDAYEELGIDFGTSIERNFTKHLSGSTGVNLSVTQIDEKTDNTTKTFGLVSAPQSLSYDTRDDRLDPHRGWNLTLGAQPFFDLLGESNPFFKTQFTGSGYIFLGTASDIVLASKIGIGGLWGTELEDIPATQRFYAGGGGSVRGFGYQEVGPQKDGDPTGGRSLVNFSLELRSKFTQTIGAVAFVDGASVTEKSTPEFNDLAIGAGLGLRYYTGYGPIRFDIATPLTQKEDLDQNYQFYISIGQAF